MKRSHLPLALLTLSCLAPRLDAHFLSRRSPLDGALDATLIVIMQEQSKDLFAVREIFLGERPPRNLLALAGFQLMDVDPYIGCCQEKAVPFDERTWILVFLKPAAQGKERWQVAGLGNCYFWVQVPEKLPDLRRMARSALSLRREWSAARDLPDPGGRTRALWPFLFSHDGCCRKQAEAELRRMGPSAGDYLGELLPTLSYDRKVLLLDVAGNVRTPMLHNALVADLRQQQKVWLGIMAKEHVSKYDEINPSGRTRSYPGRPQDTAAADLASDLYGELSYGMEGLANFKDRQDLPLFRELALWAVRYRFKQIDDVALRKFGDMPERENLPVISAIWREFSLHPFRGNELKAHDIILALAAHKYVETIPLMAPFVDAGFMQDAAQEFLRTMTGVDYGNDADRWLAWYDGNKARLAAPR